MKNIIIKVAFNTIIAEELTKIAEELESFTGAEANLYRKQIKKSIEESKNKVFEKYNN